MLVLCMYYNCVLVLCIIILYYVHAANVYNMQIVAYPLCKPLGTLGAGTNVVH